MTAVAAFSLIFVSCSAAVSLLIALPAAVAAESLANHPPALARRFWLVVTLLPPVVGLMLTVAAFLSQHGDITATPHQARVRPHFCLLQLAASPDAPFRLQLGALVACGLLAYALGRFLISVSASRSAETLARKLVASPADSGARPPVITVDSTDGDCFSLGLSRPVIVVTTALREVLDESEIEAVLAHEGCHVSQQDNRVELWLRLASDFLVWLPTTHYYLRSFRAAVEQNCDAQSAQAHSAATLIGALRKMAAVKKARQLKLRGDLAQLRPTFPGYANPEQRISALGGWQGASLALPLAVVLALEALVFAGALVWAARPLHDTLYCAANTLLKVLQV